MTKKSVGLFSPPMKIRALYILCGYDLHNQIWFALFKTPFLKLFDEISWF